MSLRLKSLSKLKDLSKRTLLVITLTSLTLVVGNLIWVFIIIGDMQLAYCLIAVEFVLSFAAGCASIWEG